MQDMAHLIWAAWVIDQVTLSEGQRIIRQSRFLIETGFFLPVEKY
jgi:hypothetical protein